MTSSALTLLPLSPGANLEAYLRTVQSMPLLTAGREQDLALRFRTLQDLDAARELVLSHLRLVVAISRQYGGYGLPQSDLIQEGNVGLMKAVRRFDPTRGVRLVSFALHWIKAEIHEYILKNWQMVKVATTKSQRKLFFNLRALKRSLGAESGVTPEQASEIAQTLRVSPEDVFEMTAAWLAETRHSKGGLSMAKNRRVRLPCWLQSRPTPRRSWPRRRRPRRPMLVSRRRSPHLTPAVGQSWLHAGFTMKTRKRPRCMSWPHPMGSLPSG